MSPTAAFPNGIPNPMIEENRPPTVAAIRAHRADLGLAWDGDFDRCFFFDEHGAFVEGYYIVGLLASVLLRGVPGGKVVHDPRLTWNTIDIVERAGGEAVLSKSGHAFIKQRMREVDGGVRRGDERAPLFPALRLLRQRHDSLAADRADPERIRSAALGAGGRAHRAFIR